MILYQQQSNSFLSTMYTKHHIFIFISVLYSSKYIEVHSYLNCGGVQKRYVCDASHPQSFHICLGENKHSLVCPGNLHFNAQTQICDWPGTTYCPYDNYAGDKDDNDNEMGKDYDDNHNDNSDVNYINKPVKSSSYQSLSAAASKSNTSTAIKNPYQNAHEDRRKKFHEVTEDSKTPLSTTYSWEGSLQNQITEKDSSDTHDTDEQRDGSENEKGQKASNTELHRILRKFRNRRWKMWADTKRQNSVKTPIKTYRTPSLNVPSVSHSTSAGRRQSMSVSRKKQSPSAVSLLDIKSKTDNNMKYSAASATGKNYSRIRGAGGRKPSAPRSPFAPPSDAYNIYSHMVAKVKQNKPRGLSESKRFWNKNNSKHAVGHQSRWYQQSSISTASNKKSQPLSRVKIMPTKKAHETTSLSKNKYAPIKTKPTRYQNTRASSQWIQNYFGGNKKTSTTYKTNSAKKVEDIGAKIKNTRFGNGKNRQKYSPTVKERRTFFRHTNYSRNNKTQWSASAGKSPIRHPRIETYRPSKLSDLMDDHPNSLTVKNNIPTLPLKRPPPKSIPTFSVSGKRIHPYRPKGYKPPVASKTYHDDYSFTNSKVTNAYMSDFSKKMNNVGKCSSSWCKLPSCRCIGSDIPGGLSNQDVPMMIMLTFDDGVSDINLRYYQQIFDGSLRNPNGCPVKGTFFVSGIHTDFNQVSQLQKDGHEMASHTLSHRTPSTWWANAGIRNWEMEVVGMRNKLSEKSNIPKDAIQGMRAPFLQVGGDDQYAMLEANKFRYDSSMVTGSYRKDNRPPIWPFTLDTPPSVKYCDMTPCPKKSYPGLWEIPLIRWYGNTGMACAMPDACTIGSGYKGTMDFLEDNFKRHYNSNKAPLGIFLHSVWFDRKHENFQALRDFLANVLHRGDVWVLTASQVLDWMERPQPISSLGNIPSWQCSS